MNIDPGELGLVVSPSTQVWGVVIDTSYDVGVATLVAFADGTTSLYYSTGGGILGSPEYGPLAEAGKAMVDLAGTFTNAMSPAEIIELPAIGQVRFTLLTYSRKLTAEVPEDSLVSGEHHLSRLYQSGRDALRQLSVLNEKKRN